MKYIDFHCDTITELHDHPEKGTLMENSLYIDLQKLKKGGCFIQDFALWVDRKETPDIPGPGGAGKGKVPHAAAGAQPSG